MLMRPNSIQTVLDEPMQLGESPLWHPEERALYWIDINGCAVHRYDPGIRTHDRWSVPCEPGCIAWCEGGLIVAIRSGVVKLDTRSGKIDFLVKAPYDMTKARFNDGRCDTSGRLWLGTIYEPRDRPLGTLYCLEKGRLQDHVKPVTVSNGVAFSPDGRTLYHTDTTAHRISAYEYDPKTGRVGTSRVFKQFSMDKSHSYGGRPDGAAVDSEGAYWCAMYEGGHILRLSPSGETLQKIDLPVRCPTMLAFGGSDLRTLFITTARHNRPATEVEQFPLSGCVLTLRVEIAGRPENAYLQ